MHSLSPAPWPAVSFPFLCCVVQEGRAFAYKIPALAVFLILALSLVCVCLLAVLQIISCGIVNYALTRTLLYSRFMQMDAFEHAVSGLTSLP